MDKNVTVNKDMSTYLVSKTGGRTQFRLSRLSALLNISQFSGSVNQARTNSMNHEQRQVDRPRVASFLIDDILAPQSLPSVIQCPSSPQEAQSSARPISTGVTDHHTHHTLNSTCLACYGNTHCVLYLFIVSYVLK